MAAQQERHGQLAFDLNCADYEVKDASFAPALGGEGAMFSCAIARVSNETMVALDRAARARTPISLWFSDCPVVLDLVTLQRKSPQSVRIIGHVLRPAAKKNA
jgi:hypothetical protein